MQPTPPKPPQAPPEPVHVPEIVDTTDDQETNDPPVTTLDTSPKNYYQAIGWLRGKIIKEEERYCVQIRDVNFPLYLPRRVMAVAANLEGQMAWMKCYPQSKGEGLSFKAVWMGTEQHEKSDPGIFVLRGVWQFIPQSRRPVFSIYRNELKNYENRPNNQHLPLIWSDQPPYRFRKDSEERPKFYQIMARLIPQRNCFGFVSQIADPLDQTPKRVKKTPPGAPNQGDKKTFKKDDKQGEQSAAEGKEKSVKPSKEDKHGEQPPVEGKETPIQSKETSVESVESVEATNVTPQETPTQVAAKETVAPPSEETPIAEAGVESASPTPDPAPEALSTAPADADATPEPAPAEEPEPEVAKKKTKTTKKKAPAKSKSRKT